jgi:hypothetical protein
MTDPMRMVEPPDVEAPVGEAPTKMAKPFIAPPTPPPKLHPVHDVTTPLKPVRTGEDFSGRMRLSFRNNSMVTENGRPQSGLSRMGREDKGHKGSHGSCRLYTVYYVYYVFYKFFYNMLLKCSVFKSSSNYKTFYLVRATVRQTMLRNIITNQ